MKLFQIITFFLFFCSGVVFSQKTIKHTVVSGESIYSIAKKYDVSESDIYELNPKSKGALLQLKTVLLIPNKKTKSKSNKEVSSSKNATETHIVESGESLYKIAKKYDISLEKLKELNPDIKPESIQIGDKIVVSAKKVKEVPKEKETPKENKPKETKTVVAEVANPVNQVNMDAN